MVFLFVLISCGSTSLITSNDGAGLPSTSEGSSTSFKTFSLGSDFPADIDIPDIDGMRSTAFVVSTANPAGVLAIDLDADPLQLSETFNGLASPAGTGIPNNVVITASNEAFLLTSTSVISFDPTSGRVYDTTTALAPVAIGRGHTNSQGASVSQTMTPSFPGGIAVSGRTLFISSANYIRTAAPAVTNPGTIQIFSINADHSLTRINTLVTSCFNPTALTIREDQELLVTNSGVMEIAAATTQPKTASCIDIVDLASSTIVATLNLGAVTASFHEIALTSDGSRGFVGSAAYGHVYELDLLNRAIIRGSANPIVVTDDNDYLTDLKLSVDDATLFVASFEESAIIPIDLSTMPYDAYDPIVVGFPAGATDDNPSGSNTGAGPIAIRPGTRGEDYAAEDLVVLTGYPGQLIATDSGRSATEPQPPLEPAPEVIALPPSPPEGDPGEVCQGFAQAVTSFTPGEGAGFGRSHLPNIVLGPPHGEGELTQSLNVVSLGFDGEIVIDLGNCHAIDDEGVDFIVFENAFFINGNAENPYHDLGRVAVSADGETFIAFPCEAGEYPYIGCAGWNPVYANPDDNDISPFDPEEAGGESYDLSDLGVDEIRYIRIQSLGGHGGPGLVGFDLDAIAVVNGKIR